MSNKHHEEDVEDDDSDSEPNLEGIENMQPENVRFLTGMCPLPPTTGRHDHLF